MYIWNTTPLPELKPARKDRTMGTLNPGAAVYEEPGNCAYVGTVTGMAAAR